jgi:CheY-like chemotaxis protein
LDLINDILDVAKIEAGKLEIVVGPVAVEPICQSSLMLVRQMARKKQLQVSFELDGAVSVLQADGRRLKQILVNLLSNACKFTPEGGHIGLTVEGDADGQAVRFVVWDTGIGIGQEQMEKLFQPFVQLDSSLSRRYQGTGLGLALVRRLAELHGGGVTVESEGVSGKGTHFTVTLPWQMEDVPATADPLPGTQASGGESSTLSVRAGPGAPLVLLVDDNEINEATVRDYLKAKGHRVVVARTGSEAIDLAREERPDVILMDIQMPEMDGLEAIRRIRADDVKVVADVPIVALTALAMPGDRERCIEAGANEYLAKPVVLRELLEVVQGQVGQRAGSAGRP